jgi:hypothetical protein
MARVEFIVTGIPPLSAVHVSFALKSVASGNISEK